MFALAVYYAFGGLMQAYANDFVVPQTWGPLSATSLMFVGTITASNANTDVIQWRGKANNAVKGTLDGTKKEFQPFTCAVDLAGIEVQCPATAGQILKLGGAIDPLPTTLTNLV